MVRAQIHGVRIFVKPTKPRGRHGQESEEGEEDGEGDQEGRQEDQEDEEVGALFFPRPAAAASRSLPPSSGGGAGRIERCAAKPRRQSDRPHVHTAQTAFGSIDAHGAGFHGPVLSALFLTNVRTELDSSGSLDPPLRVGRYRPAPLPSPEQPPGRPPALRHCR